MQSADTGSPNDEPLVANCAHWDELAEAHLQIGYDIDGFLEGDSTLTEAERDALGEVSDKSVLHLQCHIGLDILSLARLGADVTGLDFSANAISAARRIRDESGLDAEFVEADVFETPEVIDDRFDIVFASDGVLPWIGDLEGWMTVASEMARPGGRLSLVELHPIQQVLDWELEPDGSYFREGPERSDASGTHADPDAEIEQDHTTYYLWQHTLGEIVTIAIQTGFRIDALQEYPYFTHETFGGLERDEQGRFRLPGDPLPGVFGLTATRK